MSTDTTGNEKLQVRRAMASADPEFALDPGERQGQDLAPESLLSYPPLRVSPGFGFTRDINSNSNWYTYI